MENTHAFFTSGTPCGCHIQRHTTSAVRAFSTQAARTTRRRCGGVRADPAHPKITEAQIRDVVLTYTNGALLSLGASTAPTVTVVQSAPSSFPNNLSVTVSYTYAGLGLGSMLSALGQPIVLTSRTVMVNE
jgi:hypothetical protein